MSGNKINLVGKQFGRLLVVCELEERHWGQVVWSCLCDCGGKKNVTSRSLRAGNTRSCGCLVRESRYLRAKDLKGKKYGRLKVLEASGERRSGCVVWRCVCDCGNEKSTTAYLLSSGGARSCGCLRRERSSAASAKDLKSHRFGRLVAMNLTGKKSGSCLVWKCICDCGGVKDVASAALLSGKVKSCGCLRKDNGHSKAHNLEGRRFGRLVAVKATGERNSRRVVWHCCCDCGGEVMVSARYLTIGRTRSCGCLDLESRARTHLAMHTKINRDDIPLYLVGAKVSLTKLKKKIREVSDG